MTFNRSRIDMMIATVIIILSVIGLWYVPAPKGKTYNCSISEISPDYPLQVKEECRKLRATKS
jgi:hypothetical protein